MADIYRGALAHDVAAALLAMGQADGRNGPLPLREAQHRFKGVTAGALSRIAHGIEVSAPVYLAVCAALGLAPLDYLNLEAPTPHSTFGMGHKNRKRNQGVPVAATRETAL